MYKEARSVVCSVLSLAILLCLLLPSSKATSPYQIQMRARPYYVAPRPDNNQPPDNADSYPVPPHAVSSYAAPLVVISANYQTTPAAIIAPTTEIPKTEEITVPSSRAIYSENNNSNADDAAYNASEVVSLVPEVETSTSYDDGETTFWVLETSYGADAAPYEGTTHAPIYLPTSTIAI